MFGNNHRINPTESRKQLLIAESELNRAQLVQEWQTMADGVRRFSDRVKSASSLASAAALLVAAVSAFRRGKFEEAGAKASRWQALLKGAGSISTLWLAFRSRGRDQNRQMEEQKKDRLSEDNQANKIRTSKGTLC
ncbi:MAG TPA: hypothetical protein VN887_13975 [Candidatus Angelobacter sp.]|nr:hypothetical protein [Candidatus Angelobacter sp.]